MDRKKQGLGSPQSKNNYFMKKPKVIIQNLNQELPNTCGSCKHTQNDYGLVSLHCDMYLHRGKLTPHITKDDSKVRSWYKKCKFYEKYA